MALPNDSIEITAGSGETVATHTVSGKEYQVLLQASPSGHIFAESATANNRHMMSLLNASGSGKVVKVRKIFLVNLAVSAVSGARSRWEVRKISGHSGGSLVTPQKVDTNNPDLPSQITVRNSGSVTEGNMLFAHACSNDEVGATGAFAEASILAGVNLMLEHDSMQELTLRENQGVTVKFATNSSVGTYGIFAVITVT
jgi:hypothetical protein